LITSGQLSGRGKDTVGPSPGLHVTVPPTAIQTIRIKTD
jgi:hypothetical protein